MTNTDPYYIMDSYLMGMVGESLRMAVVMAKAGYPHLSARMEFIEKEYREKLEGFKGTQNKPKTENGLFDIKSKCFRDKTKECGLCHECDIDVSNPGLSNY